jgi:integrase
MSEGIRQRSPGSFEIRYPNGSGRTLTATFRGSKREAEKERRRLMGEVDRGQVSNAPARLTVAAWLETWLSHIKSKVGALTFERYETAVRLYFVPAFGSLRMRSLKPLDIQNAFTGWAENGKRRGTGGLAPSTLGLLRKTLHAALQYALDVDVITHDPMAKLRKRLPTGEAPEAKVIDAEAAADMIEQTGAGDYYLANLLAITCGMRRGEVCALKWRYCDFAAKIFNVVEARVPTRRGIVTVGTKGKRSRKVHIPDFVLEVLRQERVRQAEQLFELGVRLTDENYVCAHADGTPVNPMSWSAWMRRNGLINPHGLRHSHASLLLGDGVPLKSVSARLGHASATLTLKTYTHLMPGADADAARRVDALFFRSNSVAKRL